ncbi:MAG: gliding motility-associated C-terminal domain-containing protein [Saprospiraceae bacterium]
MRLNRLYLYPSIILILNVTLLWFGSGTLNAQQDSCVLVDMVTKNGDKGAEVCIEVRLFNFKDISAFQFSVNYDPKVVVPSSIRNLNPTLVGFGQTNARIDTAKAAIICLWDDPNAQGQTLPDGSVLFEICFKLIGAPGACSPVFLSNRPTSIEFLKKIGVDDVVYCVADKDPSDQIKIQIPTGLCVIHNACGTLNNTGSITLKAWGGQAPYTITSTNAPNGNGVLAMGGDCLIVNNLPPGTYDFNVKDASGKDTNLVVRVLAAPSITIRNDITYTREPSCYNKNDGRIGLILGGGVGNLFVGIQPINSYGKTRETGLYAGKYTITVTDSFGCTATLDTFLRADTLFANIAIDKESTCAGSCDGQVTVTARGGTPFLGGRYNYIWPSNPAANCLPGVSCSNNMVCDSQIVIVQDRHKYILNTYGCSDTIKFAVASSGELSDSSIIDSVRCFGEANGRITVFAKSKGKLNLPLTFTLINSGGNMIPGGITVLNQYTSPGLAAGTYYLNITDSLGCMLNDTLFVHQPDVLEIIENALDTTESCSPGMDALIDLRGFGGTMSYRFLWDFQGSSSPRLTGISAGTYSVTLTDAKGCRVSKVYTVTKPTGPTVTGFNNVNVICPGDSSGCVEVLFTAGSAAVNSFQWNVPGSAARICMLPAGNYNVTITDQNGCSDTASTRINLSGNPITIDSVVLQNPSCPNKADGLIIVFARGGSGLLQYSWNIGGNSQVNTNLKAGQYIVTIDDIGGCPPLTDTFTLVDPPRPQIQISGLVSPNCSGSASCDGQAIVTVTTMDTLVTVNWSSGEQTLYNSNQRIFRDTAIALCSGQQFAIISINNLCSDTIYFNVPAAVPISIDSTKLVLSPPSCYGLSDGRITVAAKGGMGPYTFRWLNSGTTGPVLAGIRDGYYYVNITDNKGCIHLDSIRLREPDSIKVQVIQGSTLDVSCAGLNDGRITTVWSGGAKGKGTFVWSPNVGQDSVLTGLSAGTYNLTVIDANNCTGTVSYTILEPSPIVANFMPIDTPFCADDQQLFTVLSATGGAGPQYRFTIQNGAPNQFGELVPLFSGVYSISVYDKNGCKIDTTIVIPNPYNNLSVEFGQDFDTIQLGDSLRLIGKINSQARIDSVIWTPRNFVSTPDSEVSFVTPNANTMFTLVVVDENGCTASDKITVIVENNRKLFVPNAISPNNDGVNDYFDITAGPDVDKIEFVDIFDRWGANLYHLENPNISGGIVSTWDGTFKSKPMNPGVYVYSVGVLFKDGYKLVYRGDITIVR